MIFPWIYKPLVTSAIFIMSPQVVEPLKKPDYYKCVTVTTAFLDMLL